MTIQSIDPLQEARWNDLAARHPSGSVFHTSQCLDALQRTYGYAPTALTTDGAHGQLRDAIVFCRVTNRLTGRRFASLPFSDDCEPPIQNSEGLVALLAELRLRGQADKCSYVEPRPRCETKRGMSFKPASSSSITAWISGRVPARYSAGLIADCIQRKIRRGEREAIEVCDGTGPEALQIFYHLLVQTRRRQGFPPQPLAWFRNIVAWATLRQFAWRTRGAPPLPGSEYYGIARPFSTNTGHQTCAFITLGRSPTYSGT